MHTEIWDATGVRFDPDTGLPSTGRWRALETVDLRPVPRATPPFTLSLNYFGSGLFHIPTGARGWSIGVLSGAVYVNGVGPLPINASLNGGNYGSSAMLGTPIQISGDSAANGIAMWEA